MVTTRGTKPLPETERRYRRNGSVGMFQKADSDQKKLRKAEEDRKAALPDIRQEKWNYRKERDGLPPDEREVEVRRNAQGRFLKKSTAQALAAHLGLMTGNQVSPPAKTKGPRT